MVIPQIMAAPMAAGPTAVAKPGLTALFGNLSQAMGPAAIGMSMLGGLFGAIGQHQQRKAQMEFSRRVEDATIQDLMSQYASMGVRAQDVIARGSEQLRNVARQGALAQGAVTASAGAAGVTGASYDALLSDYMKATLTQAAATRADIDVELTNIESQKQAMAAQAMSRINQARSSVPQQQNIFGTLLQIGAQGLTTAQAFK